MTKLKSFPLVKAFPSKGGKSKKTIILKKKTIILKLIASLLYIVIVFGISYATSGKKDASLQPVIDFVELAKASVVWLVNGLIIIQGLFQLYEAQGNVSDAVMAVLEMAIKYTLFKGILNAVQDFFGSGTMF